MKTTKFLLSSFVFALSVIGNDRCETNLIGESSRTDSRGLNMSDRSCYFGCGVRIGELGALNPTPGSSITIPSGNWITNYGTINVQEPSNEDEKVKIIGDGHGNSGIRNVNGGGIYSDGNRIAPEDYDNYFIFLLGGTIRDEVHGFPSEAESVSQAQ